jgi:hypothetical protein
MGTGVSNVANPLFKFSTLLQLRNLWQLEIALFLPQVSQFHHYKNAWTNFSLQDKYWADFSTLEVAKCMHCIYFVTE